MRHCIWLFMIASPMLACSKAPSSSSQSTTPPKTVDSRHPTPAGQTPVPKADAAYPVPEVGPEELLRFINQLAVRQPQGDSDQAYLADLQSITKSRLIAADQILEHQEIDPGLREAAIIAKLDALRTLAAIDPHALGAQFEPFVQSLIGGLDKKLALVGRVGRFQYELDRFTNGQSDDPQPLLEQLRRILDDPLAGHPEFLATQYAGVALDGRGYRDQASEVLRTVGEHFEDHDDPSLAAEAKNLLAKNQFRIQVITAMQGDSTAVASLLDSVTTLLADKNQLSVEVLDTTLNAGQMLEFSGSFEAARQVFSTVHDAFKNHQDQQLAEQAKRSVAAGYKRLSLIGDAMSIEGHHIDGTSFVWSDYQGKVVLVDFWTTWSLPWQEELPNLLAAYDRFHDQGFEVVGINLDDDRNRVYQYLRNTKLPWPVVVDETVGGLGNPNAMRYGVEAVPFVVLIGRDGKVADIHVRSAELDKSIQKLLQVPVGAQHQSNQASPRRR